MAVVGEVDVRLALVAAADDVAAVPPGAVLPRLLRRPEPRPAHDGAHHEALVGAEERHELLGAGVVGERADLAVVVVGVVERRRHLPDRERLGGVRLGAVDRLGRVARAASTSSGRQHPARPELGRLDGVDLVGVHVVALVLRAAPGERHRGQNRDQREPGVSARASPRPRTACGNAVLLGHSGNAPRCYLPRGRRPESRPPQPVPRPGGSSGRGRAPGVDAARSGASSGSPATIRNGTTPAHTVSSRSSGSSSPYPSLTLTDHSVEREAQDQGGGELLLLRRPQRGPPAGEQVLGQPLEGGQLLVVRHPLGDPEHGRAAVVHARLERRPRVDQPVQVHDVHAHRPRRPRARASAGSPVEPCSSSWSPSRAHAIGSTNGWPSVWKPTWATYAASRIACSDLEVGDLLLGQPPDGGPGRRLPRGHDAPSAAETTSRASSCTRARCSGPWNDSA